MGRTLYEKIWDAHRILESDDGQALLHVARHLVHDGSVHAFEFLRDRNLKVRRPDQVFATPDHGVSTLVHKVDAIADPEQRRVVQLLDRNTRDAGIVHFALDDPRQGIVHVVGPEQGITQPGIVLLCGDSHTSTHGALGALAFGAGASEITHVLATQTTWQRRSKTMRVTVEGRLPVGVTAKDVILAIIAKVGANGAAGHVIEYAGSTLRAAQMYVETHPKENLTVLIDYYGREYSDALEVCRWWYHDMLPKDENGARQLALRIDTHGERYAEGLDYEKSTEIVVNWLHVPNEYEAVRYVMGEEAFDADSLNIVKDRVRKVLFGTGVSVAAVIQLRQALDANGFNACKIVGSSGFNLFKCKMFANARAPLDMVGTGSFIPDNFNDTFATADIFMYDGKTGIKLGREKLFHGLTA